MRFSIRSFGWFVCLLSLAMGLAVSLTRQRQCEAELERLRFQVRYLESRDRGLGYLKTSARNVVTHFCNIHEIPIEIDWKGFAKYGIYPESVIELDSRTVGDRLSDQIEVTFGAKAIVTIQADAVKVSARD
ncbi:hypothetical protein [Anatilimnocola floriformis]|uniref:hypothetical protein n=1 Tax=Anatilimnocola floriformis TaxID=2948575 RepID=UPI0020C43477|nr:hypothetical protein [Anatilimnocola floriformis]